MSCQEPIRCDLSFLLSYAKPISYIDENISDDEFAGMRFADDHFNDPEYAFDRLLASIVSWRQKIRILRNSELKKIQEYESQRQELFLRPPVKCKNISDIFLATKIMTYEEFVKAYKNRNNTVKNLEEDLFINL